MKIGILGTGRIAQTGIVEPAAALGHTITVVAARDRVKADHFASTYGVERVAGSFEEVINDPAVDLIYNPLPNTLHAPWNIRALEAGKNVLTEKPFAASADEARQVLEIAATAGRHIVEGYHYVHHPVTRRVFEIIESGEIGEVHRLEVEMVSESPGPNDIRWSAECAGGSLMDMGCYGIHLMFRLAPWCGGDPAPTLANFAWNDARGVDQRSLVTVRYPSGATASVNANLVGHDVVLRYTVYGSRGRVSAYNFVLPHVDDRVMVETKGLERIEHLGRKTSYTYQLEAVDALINRRSAYPLVPQDSLGPMEILDWARNNASRHTVRV